MKYIPNILEEHFEELQFVWSLRQRALRSPLHSLQAFLDFEERLEAHARGLLVNSQAAATIARDHLESQDAGEVFASVFTLLRLNERQAAEDVCKALYTATPKQLSSFRDALAYGPIDLIQGPLRELSAWDRPDVAAVCLEVLASHGAPFDLLLLEKLRKHELPTVRESVWKAVGAVECRLAPEAYEAGMKDEDPRVRGAALLAGISVGHAGVLETCRGAATRPEAEQMGTLRLLAILGTAGDVESVLSLGRVSALGPQRCTILGSFGHPRCVPLLLEAMKSDNPALAAAAGDAFTKITGCDVASDRKATVLPEKSGPADDFDEEFADEVVLPDVARAEAHWERERPALASATRVCRGFALSDRVPESILAELDVESRWELFLRARWAGRTRGPLSDFTPGWTAPFTT